MRNGRSARPGTDSGAPVELRGNPIAVPNISSASRSLTSRSSAKPERKAARRTRLRTTLIPSVRDGRHASSSDTHAISRAHVGSSGGIIPVCHLVPSDRCGKTCRQRRDGAKTETALRAGRVQTAPWLAVWLTRVPLDLAVELTQAGDHFDQIAHGNFVEGPQVYRFGSVVSLGS